MSGKQAKAKRVQGARSATLAAAALAAKLDGQQFWHGGAPGLSVGTTLLTLEAALRAGRHDTAHLAQSAYLDGTTNTRRVYFTTDREMARAYCGLLQVSGQPNGTLYRVEPIGQIEPDPDFAGRNVSWCAPGARIVAVEEERVNFDAFDATQRIGPYMAWDNGDPIYDSEGHFLPSPEMRSYGFTAHWLAERYRPWSQYDQINADLQKILLSGNRPGA